MKTLTEARRILQEEQKKARGAYVRGVYVYAFDLIDVLEGYESEQLEAATNKKDLKKSLLIVIILSMNLRITFCIYRKQKVVFCDFLSF